MMDVHTHILPGIDDGSRNTECSLQMLRLEAAQGCRALCLTPHYYAEESIPEFRRKVEKSLQKLQAAVNADPAGRELPALIPAAEVAYFPGISRCEELEGLCVAGTRTLLLELPYAEWQDFEMNEVVSIQLDRKLQVVLVHPERLVHFGSNENKLRKLLQFPLALQINAGSLAPGGLFSPQRSRSKTALRLLQETPYPLLGSDCHNLTSRPPNLSEGRGIVEEKLGPAFLEKIDETSRMLCT